MFSADIKNSLKNLSQYFLDRVTHYLLSNRTEIENLDLNKFTFLGNIYFSTTEVSEKLNIIELLNGMTLEETDNGFTVGFGAFSFYPKTNISKEKIITVLNSGFITKRLPAFNITTNAQRDTDIFANKIEKGINKINYVSP